LLNSRMPSASVSDRKNLEEFDCEQYRVRADRLVVRRLSEDEDDNSLSAIARVLVKIIADAHARRGKHEDENRSATANFGDWLFHSP
jgi:hypothetical protein